MQKKVIQDPIQCIYTAVLSTLQYIRTQCFDRLPNSLSDNIIKKRVSSYSTRARDSLLVPRFSSRYMKDSVAYRGSILWNTVTNKHNDLVKTRYSDLMWKLKSLAIYNDFNFKVTSPSTCSFRFEEFLYT